MTLSLMILSLIIVPVLFNSVRILHSVPNLTVPTVPLNLYPIIEPVESGISSAGMLANVMETYFDVSTQESIGFICTHY